MNLRIRPLVALTVLLLAAASAPGIGYTDYLEDLQLELVRLQGQLPGPENEKLFKVVQTELRNLQLWTTAETYLGEYKALSKSAKKLVKSFGTDGDLLAAFESALASYRADIVAGRNALAAAEPLSKNIAKVDSALAKADTQTSITSRLKSYSKIAKTLGAYLTFETPGDHYAWAISGLTPTPVASSRDFDGDLTLDNALKDVAVFLSGQGFDLEAAIADRVAQGTRVTLLWMWGVHSLTNDPDAQFAFLNGIDNDGDTSNKFSGLESFLPEQVLSELDFLPRRRGPAFTDGSGDWAAPCAGDFCLIADLTVPASIEIHASGTTVNGPTTGQVFFLVSGNALVSWLRGLGMPANLEPGVLALADLDTNADLAADAFSVGLDYAAVKAGIQ